MKTLTSFLLLISAAMVCASADARPRVSVPRVETGPDLDGQATEKVWERAARLEGFTIYSPNTEVAPRFAASARAVRTDAALYFFVQIDAPDAEVRAPMTARDDWPGGDMIQIQLDPEGSGRRGYEFIVGAAGGLRDSTLNEVSGSDRAYDALFDAATFIHTSGWSVEVRIPFQSLRFDPARDGWGAHVFVQSWHHQQSLSWAPIDLDVNDRLQIAGRIEGMQGLEPGRAIELLPSLTAGWAESGELGLPPCAFGAELGQFEVCGAQLAYGMGAKWGLSPSFTLDAVFNPDFSQVEADPGQLTVNNRFALFLAERRPFFVEGRDIFSSPLNPVYTRSINKPRFALKLTGGQDGSRVGALVAIDEEPPDSVVDESMSPSSSPERAKSTTTILRGQQDMGAGTTMGIFAIDRRWHSAQTGQTLANNRVFGVDGRSNLTKEISAEGHYFTSLAQGFDDTLETGSAARGRLVYRTQHARLQGSYERVGEGFRSEAGFIPRVGFESFFTKLDFYHRGEKSWGRFISPGIYTNTILDEEGEVVERSFGGNTYWLFGGRVSVFGSYNRVEELLDEQRFELDDFYLELEVETLKWLDFSVASGFGGSIIRDSDLLDGREPFLGWQRSPRVSVSLKPISWLTWNLSHRERALFESRGGLELVSQPITRSELQCFFTRDLSLRYIMQWQELQDALSNDLLLSYRPSPGTVFFLGYREETDLEGASTLSERSIFAKISVLYSL